MRFEGEGILGYWRRALVRRTHDVVCMCEEGMRERLQQMQRCRRGNLREKTFKYPSRKGAMQGLSGWRELIRLAGILEALLAFPMSCSLDGPIFLHNLYSWLPSYLARGKLSLALEMAIASQATGLSTSHPTILQLE